MGNCIKYDRIKQVLLYLLSLFLLTLHTSYIFTRKEEGKVPLLDLAGAFPCPQIGCLYAYFFVTHSQNKVRTISS